MAEPEAVRLQGPSFTCGTTTSTNFPHRRHYAVRRKLGRAKTARLTAPQPSTDTVDEDDGPASTVTKDEATDDDAKCHSNLNDSTECDDDEESDGVESNVEDLEEEEEEEEEEESATTTEDNETSVEADDEEDDDNQTEVDQSEVDTDEDDGDGNGSTTTSASCASQLFHDECVVVVPAVAATSDSSNPIGSERFSRTVPVITLDVIQPGPSNDQVEEESFFVDPAVRLSTASSSLLYPVDERDAITPTYLTTTTTTAR